MSAHWQRVILVEAGEQDRHMCRLVLNHLEIEGAPQAWREVSSVLDLDQHAPAHPLSECLGTQAIAARANDLPAC